MKSIHDAIVQKQAGAFDVAGKAIGKAIGLGGTAAGKAIGNTLISGGKAAGKAGKAALRNPQAAAGIAGGTALTGATVGHMVNKAGPVPGITYQTRGRYGY